MTASKTTTTIDKVRKEFGQSFLYAVDMADFADSLTAELQKENARLREALEKAQLLCETCAGSGYQGYDDATLYRKRLYRFINGFRSATGRIKPGYLPDPSQINLPTITIPKEQFVKFRNDYHLFVEFAAWVCGVSSDELTVAHLAQYKRKSVEVVDAQ